MNKPKFNMVEIIFGSIIALLIDIVSAFADILAGVGGFIIQSLSWLLFTLWFQLKGATASANLVRRFLVPIATQIVPFIPTQIFTFLVSVYMENHPEKFSLVTSAATLSKMDVGKLKNVRETRGTFAAAKEARTMYRTARQEIEGDNKRRGLSKEEYEAQSRRIREKWGGAKKTPGEQEYRKAA